MTRIAANNKEWEMSMLLKFYDILENILHFITNKVLIIF